jgi:hypothetical protein
MKGVMVSAPKFYTTAELKVFVNMILNFGQELDLLVFGEMIMPA